MDTAIIAGLSLALVAISAALIFVILRMNKRINSLTAGINEKNLQEAVEQFTKTLSQQKNDITLMNQEFKRIREDTSNFIRKIGLVRYQGFKDTGGDQSFSVTLLNERDSGIIITSLYGRDVSKMYAKKVTEGKPEHTLTSEEEEALHQAIES